MTARPASSGGGVDGHALEVPCDAIGLARPFRHGRRSSAPDDLSFPPWRPLHRSRWLEAGGLRIASLLAPKDCPALGVRIHATAQSVAPFRHTPFRNAGRRCRANVRDTVRCPHSLGVPFQPAGRRSPGVMRSLLLLGCPHTPSGQSFFGLERGCGPAAGRFKAADAPQGGHVRRPRKPAFRAAPELQARLARKTASLTLGGHGP